MDVVKENIKVEQMILKEEVNMEKVGRCLRKAKTKLT